MSGGNPTSQPALFAVAPAHLNLLATMADAFVRSFELVSAASPEGHPFSCDQIVVRTRVVASKLNA
jgi:hypothetical protein